jgi:hypothetical protein
MNGMSGSMFGTIVPFCISPAFFVLQFNFLNSRAGEVMLKIYEPPETQKPRDIAIGAAGAAGVKLTPNEKSLEASQFANSIG